jgi:hypothetical protein
MIAAEYLIMSFEVIQFEPGYVFSLVLQIHFYEFNQKCFSIVICVNRMNDGGKGVNNTGAGSQKQNCYIKDRLWVFYSLSC